jgi:hypothetical protein
MESGAPTSSGSRRASSSRVPRSCAARPVLSHEAVAVLARPPPRLDLGARQEGFREAAEREKVAQLGGRLQGQLGGREGVEPEHVVATLQRIAPEAVEVQLRAAGDQNPLAGTPAVSNASTGLAGPCRGSRRIRGETGSRRDPLAVLRDVPARVACRARAAAGPGSSCPPGGGRRRRPSCGRGPGEPGPPGNEGAESHRGVYGDPAPESKSLTAIFYHGRRCRRYPVATPRRARPGPEAARGPSRATPGRPPQRGSSR